MINGLSSPLRTLVAGALVTVALAGMVWPLATLVARPAGAANPATSTSTGVGVGRASSAVTSSGKVSEAEVPRCPPDCGSVAAGSPLLVPYVVANPGPGWLVLPSSSVAGYAATLQRNVSRQSAPGTESNVAAARWELVRGNYALLVDLVSSTSLTRSHFSDPTQNAAHLCTAAKGVGRGQLTTVPGVPGSVAGLCAYAAKSAVKGATVASFIRGNVAVLMQFTSRTSQPIDFRTVTLAAQQQYLAVPPGGVAVSSGGLDVPLLLVWLLVVAGVAYGAVECARRRHDRLGPWHAVVEGWQRRKLALGVALLAVVGAMAFSMVDSSLLHGVGQWYEAGFNDFWRNWSDAATITYANGFGHLYALDRSLETAPALQVLIAPVARLASGLPFPNPSAVLYPEAFWVAGPLFLGCMALPICAGDRWLSLLGMPQRTRRLAVLGTMAVTLPPIALFGHPEDLLALGAMLYGLAAAMEGRYRATGWWLGVGLAFQFFAFLAVPIALVLLGRRDWWRALVPIVVVPLAFLAVPLLAEPSATLQQLIHQRVYEDMGYISPTWNLDPGVAAFIRACVALASIPAALVLARLRPKDQPSTGNVVVWMVAGLLALRVLEPELVPYFLAPTLALLPISAARSSRWWLVATCAMSIWLNWWVHVAVHARWSLWLLLIGQLVVIGWLAWPRPQPQPQSQPQSQPQPTVGASPTRKRQPARLAGG